MELFNILFKSTANLQQIVADFLKMYKSFKIDQPNLTQEEILKIVMSKKIAQLQLSGTYSKTLFPSLNEKDFEHLTIMSISVFIFKMLYYESEGLEKE